jgi:hypothetical protein
MAIPPVVDECAIVAVWIGAGKSSVPFMFAWRAQKIHDSAIDAAMELG